MKFLIACDSFKGSLSASQVCRAIENGIRSVLDNAQTDLFPLADGGEGTVDCFFENCGGEIIRCETVNCFFEPMTAEYLMADANTAVIETAAASGITTVPADRLNPMKASTYGTGILIKDAVSRGAKRIILGLGGSATNDGGTGALNAMGIVFLDESSNALSPTGENLIKIRRISRGREFEKYGDVELILACDVENVFCGESGAAHVFARQKGADNEMIEALDNGLFNLANVVKLETNVDLTTVRGAGAAGGLAGGLLAFTDSEIKSGFIVLADACGFEKAVVAADAVITGEGKTDSQTACGKLPYRVAQLAKKHSKPCILVCGQLDADIEKLGFYAAYPLVADGVTAEYAIENAARLLTEKGKAIAKTY